MAGLGECSEMSLSEKFMIYMIERLCTRVPRCHGAQEQEKKSEREKNQKKTINK